LSFFEEFKFYISKSLNILQLHPFFPVHLPLLSHQTFYHLFLLFIKLFIIFFSCSSSLLSHQTFYPLFLPIIFTFIPSKFISYFSPDHLHLYPIKLSIIFFSRSSSLLFHQTFCSQIQIARSSQVLEPLPFQNNHFRSRTTKSICKCCFSTIKYIF